MGRDLRALLVPGSGESLGFAALEMIENGILVHYVVALRTRQRVPAHMLGGGGDPALVPQEKIVENWFLSKKTIHCPTTGEVFKAIETAVISKQEIDRLEKDGKFHGSQIENA